MRLFEKQTPVQKEWAKLMKREQKFIRKRLVKKESIINEKLEDKIPATLQETLNAAFAKAFTLIFAKGTSMIEKTYRREKIEEDYQIRQYIVDVKQDLKSLRSFTKKTRDTSNKNLLLTGASGIGMGVLGIGIPDIPLFTSMILKNMYEIALQYGYQYETENERYFILLLIQTALSYGEDFQQLNQKVDQFIESVKLPQNYDEKMQIIDTADALSKELLYMKFLQGIPLVGAIGGAYDVIYMKQISEYAMMKYRKRYLHDLKCVNNR